MKLTNINHYLSFEQKIKIYVVNVISNVRIHNQRLTIKFRMKT